MRGLGVNMPPSQPFLRPAADYIPATPPSDFANVAGNYPVYQPSFPQGTTGSAVPPPVSSYDSRGETQARGSLGGWLF